MRPFPDKTSGSIKPATGREVEAAREARARAGKIRVAVLDDDPQMLRMLKKILDGSDEFIGAGFYATAEEALARMPGASPELALIDLRLPGLPGWQCARRLRSKIPGIKIVMMTGAADAVTLGPVAESPNEGTIYKPFSPEQFLAELKQALRRNVAPPSGEPLPNANPTPDSAKLEVKARPLGALDVEMLKCFELGKLYKEAAVILKLTYRAFRRRQHKLFHALGVQNRAEAVRAWREKRRRR